MLKVTERFNDRMRTNDDEIKKLIEKAKKQPPAKEG